MNKKVLKNYAKLIARKGVNIQKGQEVVIRAELDQPEFVLTLTKECYKAGAKSVTVEWSYQPLTRVNVRNKCQKLLNRVPAWEIEKLKEQSRKLPCMIYLTSEDPDGLKGVNQTKLVKASQAKYPLIKPIKDQMENKYGALREFPAERGQRRYSRTSPLLRLKRRFGRRFCTPPARKETRLQTGMRTTSSFMKSANI